MPHYRSSSNIIMKYSNVEMVTGGIVVKLFCCKRIHWLTFTGLCVQLCCFIYNTP
jgi:hypothetical protein